MIRHTKLKSIEAREFSHDTSDTSALLREAADWLDGGTLTAIIYHNSLSGGYHESIVVVTEG